MGPLAFYFGFIYSNHDQIVLKHGFFFDYNETNKATGLGVTGLWIGVICGLSFQNLCYFILWCYTDWEKISKRAFLRN